MGKLGCPCGNVLDNICSPNKHIGWLFSDLALEQILENEGNIILRLSRSIWECSICGRLAIDHPDAGDRTVKWYIPENGEPGKLMEK